MQTSATTVDQYLAELPADRKKPMTDLRQIVADNLAPGFQELMMYGMISYVVPHSLYPKGYHVTPEVPLPYLSIASQKNFIAVYHMGVYADKKINAWFVSEYPKYSKLKLDMGKSCIRFKKPSDLPLQLIGELAAKLTVKDWISLYEKSHPVK
ncbi:MAG: DUF1801 domain-containing protein, partial [Chitinophagaceae bacterium]